MSSDETKEGNLYCFMYTFQSRPGLSRAVSRCVIWSHSLPERRGRKRFLTILCPFYNIFVKNVRTGALISVQIYGMITLETDRYTK